MKLFALALPLLAMLPAISHALPRDAVAVLNRCGNPFLGDATVYENSLAGGHRVLSYERGTLNFSRVANNGWSFVSGVHRGGEALNAEQMEVFMPCLKDALADSAAIGPIVQISSYQRVETSMKRAYQKIVLATFLFLGALGFVFVWLSRRSVNSRALTTS